MADTSSKAVVLAALVANTAIAILKFLGYLLTGSPSMLSETYHSISDSGNQVLLLVGLEFSQRPASRVHPYGWGKSEFFYGFVVSMFLFLLAGWESLREGWHKLGEVRSGHTTTVGYGEATILGETVPGWAVALGILALAFLFELYALRKATRGMRQSQARNRYDDLWETFRRTKAAAILTAFTEDALALVGLVLAALGLGLSVLTGNPIFDALGAMAIGALLMGIAILLAWEQKRLLLGEAMEVWQEKAIVDLLADHEEVEAVRNLRTVYFGPERVVLTADLSFRADLPSSQAARLVDRIETTVRERFPEVATIYLESEHLHQGDEDALEPPDP